MKSLLSVVVCIVVCTSARLALSDEAKALSPDERRLLATCEKRDSSSPECKAMLEAAATRKAKTTQCGDEAHRTDKDCPGLLKVAAEERMNAKLDRINSGFTAGGSIGADALQAIAQVVLKKAVRAGWTELSKKLEALAGCGGEPDRLPETCKVLHSARIEDLLASPRVLLDAFVADVLAVVKTSAIYTTAGPVAAGLVLAVDGWGHGGLDGVLANVRAFILSELKAAADANCPSSNAKAVFWVVGECLLQSTEASTAWAELPSCPFDELLLKCGSSIDRSAVRQVAQLATRAIDGKGAPKASIELFFEWAKLADASHKDLLDGLKSLFLGLVQRDWIRSVIGIGAVADSLNTKDCGDKCSIDKKLLKIVGAVGQFAETYTDGKNDPATASAAREKVIEDLVTSLVNRGDRDHGAIVSLGGTLGAFGGKRFNDNGSEFAWPIRLTLGAGLQTYHARECGLHISVEAFDLGQYVTYSKGALDVGSPELKSVFIVGGTLGVWFLNRDTPMFFGVHGSVSPFVRTKDDKSTYELGAMFGIYVPLLDFN